MVGHASHPNHAHQGFPDQTSRPLAAFHQRWQKAMANLVAKSAPLLMFFCVFFVLTFSSFMENPLVGKRLKSKHPARCNKAKVQVLDHAELAQGGCPKGAQRAHHEAAAG